MNWSADELAALRDTDELQISSHRADGALRPAVTIWMVVIDGRLYVRSAGGSNNWYRRALASGSGSVRAGRTEREVTFVDDPAAPHDDLDAAYRQKYRRYAGSIVDNVVGDWMRTLTLRVDPA